MPSEVTIPRLGWNMDEGIFVGWLKEDGQSIAVGEPLFSLEGDKSTQEIESLEEGILRIPEGGPTPGQTLAVGTVIGYLVGPGESLPTAARTAHGQADRGESAPSKLAQSHAAGGSHHRSSRSDRPRISPRARRAADELGVDLSTLRGTGRTGRIRERDVLAAARSVSADPGGSALSPRREALANAPHLHDGSFEVLPISPIRRTIAQRMMLSTQSTAPVTLTTTVDATHLVGLRRQFKAVAAETDLPPIGYGDIIVKLTAFALAQHPRLAARWESDRILVPRGVHIGIAVDTDAGLMVPVLREVSKLSLRQVATQSRELIEKARAGTLTIAESQGSSFTVTNLGAFGIDAFTPVINPPECAILGLGRIRSQVVPVGDRYVTQDQITLSLTFDHRIVDGAPAARFLQNLSAMIQNPSPWLLSQS